MTTTKNHRALSALLILAAVTLVPATAPQAEAVGAGVIGSCSNYDDDPGMGGSDVSCQIDCKKGAGLAMAAAAGDPQASVAGDFNCGGQAAPCGPDPIACAGVSAGLTPNAGEGECSAESDEFWSSTIVITCLVLGGLPSDSEPWDIICDNVPSFPTCDDRGTVAWVRDLCQEEILLADTEGLAEVLLPPALDNQKVEAFVAAIVYADGDMTVASYDAAKERCDVIHVEAE